MIAGVIEGRNDASTPLVLAESDRNSEEALLIERFRAGDVSAFEQIYRNHHRYVQMQARRVISDPHRAEDIAQEAFLRLVRQLLATDGQIKLRAWLHRTLDRTDRGHPEQEAESGEVRDTIRRVIATMPPRYRAILALRELEGLDYISIGEAMNLSVSAVESLLFRARRRFTETYRQVATDAEARTPVRRRRRRGAPVIPG